ncbi:cell wall hydrolase [Paenibacillus kobensis]|uniref:cell wall hydrolase n=1 Tax=Paenibacillus kobensis TaxID=59841 RepID=UPI000FDB11FB|nr:cell wall hydrolase [Paenibacillus kobensis]
MIRGSKLIRRLTCMIGLGMFLLCLGPLAVVSAADNAAGVSITLDGEKVKLSDSAIVRDGRTYVPVAPIARMLGANVSWDSDNEELTLNTALNDTAVFGNGVPVVYFNEVRYRMDALPFTNDGRLYVPLRQLADVLHADLNWKTSSDVAELASVLPETVTDERGLDEISKDFGIDKTELLKRNGLDGKTKIKSGAKLKVIIPSFLDNPAPSFTESDLALLAKITMVEAGNESYEGMLAIANVIQNRVNDSRFPDTIRGVIYSGKQFPPAHNGLLDKSKPNATAQRAAKDALNGKNNVKDAVYFFNPAVSGGPFWDGLDVVVTIGSHSFAK